MRNRSTKIVFPAFNGYEVRVICTRNIITTGRRLREKLEDAEASFVTKKENGIHDKGWLIFKENAEPGTIAHECSHAIKAMFIYIGAKQEDELFAHHLDYLVGKVHKFLGK